MVAHFDTVHERDGRTDGRTLMHSITWQYETNTLLPLLLLPVSRSLFYLFTWSLSLPTLQVKLFSN